MSLLAKIKQALRRTKESISKKLFEIFKAKELDTEFYEELEFALIASDMGVIATQEILEELKEQVYQQRIVKPEQAKILLKQIMCNSIDYEIEEFHYPLVLLIAGVNGVGKTTAIGKLAHLFRQQNKSVTIAAADTFRAAASEQLEVWAKRAGARIITHKEGADPAAVVFDALSSQKAQDTDVVLIDTAGRLQNKKNLMEELKKINRVILRELPNADNRNYIVLDASTGQNALSQVKIFDEAIDIDGIILTKLDGTAKGGVIMAISAEYQVPVVYIGVGEGINDLVEFHAMDFIDAIL